MDIETVLEKIKSDKPRVVYLSGKTCTGKTTFAGLIEQLQYSRVELDKIVTESIVEQYKVLPNDAFLTAYRGEGPKEHTAAFVNASRQEILAKSTTSAIVVEGAIAKAEILKSIFSGLNESFFFIYFHPSNVGIYARRIKERFEAGAHNDSTGLPKRFWSLVEKSDVDNFLSTGNISPSLDGSILKFAETSTEESLKRLQHLQQEFPLIIVVTF